MKPVTKYVLIGAIAGGLLPALLHPLGFTAFATSTDILTHTVSTAIGAIIGFIIFKSKT